MNYMQELYDSLFGGPPLRSYPGNPQEDWLRRNDERILSGQSGLASYAGVDMDRAYQNIIYRRLNKMPLNNFNWSVVNGHILIEVECQKFIVHDKKELKEAIARLVDNQLWPLIKEKLDAQKKKK